MTRLFVSYAQEDRATVSPYIDGLVAANYDVWWDGELRAGEDWSKIIDQELKRADSVVIFWSQHSVNSPWVRIEAHFGKQHRCLVPVRIDAVDLPDEYRLVQTIDATGRDSERLLGEICEAVAGIRKRSHRRNLRRFGVGAIAVALLLAGYGFLTQGRVSGIHDPPPLVQQPAWRELQQAATLKDLENIENRFIALKQSEPGAVLPHAGLCATYLRRFDLSSRDSDLVMAQDSCATATALDKGSTFAIEAGGWLAYYTGDTSRAANLFQKAISMDRSSATAWLGLASTLDAQGDKEGAEQALIEATVAQPGLWRTQNAMALFMQRQGNTQESIRRFELALQLSPNNIAVLNNLGISKLFNQDYGGAISAWSEVLENTPPADHGPTLTNIGSAYYLMRDYRGARIALDKASRLMIDDYRIWDNLADTLVGLGEDEAAVAARRRALDRAELTLAQNGSDHHALANSAASKSALGLDGWRNDIDKAIAALPEDPEIRRIAALCFMRAGETDIAAQHYAESLNLGYPEFLLVADYQFDALHKNND